MAIALAICALGTITGGAIVHRSIWSKGAGGRYGGLLLAGVVTGLAIWSTHFTAMLGYRRDLVIRYDLTVAALSLLSCILLTLIGGLIGPLHRQSRGILGGVLVGVAIAVAHFLDMMAMEVPGALHHNYLTSAVAVAMGLGLAGLSGRLLILGYNQAFAWPAMAAMFGAVVSIHFIAMSGVTIHIDPGSPSPGDNSTSAEQLAAFVVAAFLMILIVAIGYAWHSASVARATAQEQQRLIDTLQELRVTKDHHRAYVELNPQIAWVADPDGRVTEIAPLWSKIVGIDRDEALGAGWLRTVHADDRRAVLERWAQALATNDKTIADIRYRVRIADGSYKWFRARAAPRFDTDGKLLAWYGSLEDIHEQVLAEERLRASEERYRLASLATNDVIWDWSFESGLARWAGAYQVVLGYPELQGETTRGWWQERVHPDDVDRVNASLANAISSGADYWREEYRFRIASGEWIEIRTRCVIARDAVNQAPRLVGSMLDITQQKQAEAELNWAAFHDPLTRLPNRSLYRRRKQEAIEQARMRGHYVALIVLDLNEFKLLNDTLGHSAGDKVLVEAAQRLRRVLPEGSTLARLGGDEFAIVLLESAPDDYKEVMSDLSRSLAAPVEFGAMNLSVGYSAGVAIWPLHGDDLDELLIAADLALYEAKNGMPGTIREFEPSMREASEQRSRMLSLARSALDSDRIVPFYQPKIELRTGQIVGWEALLRVRSEDEDLLLPPSTIAAAFGDAGLSIELTDRMFERVFADLAHWRAAGVVPGRIAINLSEQDFRYHDLIQRLRAKLGDTEDDFSFLDVEVTETVLVSQGAAEITRTLSKLRSLGVQVALDDFGTGYASLTHLQQFPVDGIKIDRSFIERINENDPKATAVIDAVLQMSRRLGMLSIAEGIETVQQARYLHARGCTIGQGYFFSKAVPSHEVASLLGCASNLRWAIRS